MGHTTRSIRTALAALALVTLPSAATIVAVSARDQTNGPFNPPPPGAINTPHAGGMMGGAMMQGDFADRMFLEMMIPHHQRAIDMGNDALTNAQHPELQALAKDIIAVQTAEITEMQGYLRAWYGITS